MQLIPSDLIMATDSARERLGGLSRSAAIANTVPASAARSTMAQTARTAIFIDAVTAAMHARLEELKSVAK
jgi:hypothetical protein